MAKIEIDLKARPDGYGFEYGVARRGGRILNINVMPPQAHWDGDFELEGYEPHPTDWVLYIEGEEVARLQERAGIEAEFIRVLTEG
ncbi:MAG: hypothetical protein AB7U75_17320 [Hyphomicrobiaceae bacterium]